MRQTILRLVPLVAIWSFTSGCAGPEKMGRHERVESDAGHPIRCQKCYDYTQAALRGTARVHWPRQRMRYREIKRHLCPECKSEMVIYEENGVPMIKCSTCAPNGVPCDLCRPPLDFAASQPAD